MTSGAAPGTAAVESQVHRDPRDTVDRPLIRADVWWLVGRRGPAPESHAAVPASESTRWDAGKSCRAGDKYSHSSSLLFSASRPARTRATASEAIIRRFRLSGIGESSWSAIARKVGPRCRCKLACTGGRLRRSYYNGRHLVMSNQKRARYPLRLQLARRPAAAGTQSDFDGPPACAGTGDGRHRNRSYDDLATAGRPYTADRRS